MPRSKAILNIMLSLATLSAPVLAQGQGAHPGRPGTLNYIEGQASMEGQQLTQRSVGHAELQAGQYLATATGKAEILLTPGIFLRLDNNSTVKMVSPDLTHTEVELTQGRASVEADQIYKQNTILIDLKNGQTQVLKNGLYEFDASNNTVRVFDGKAGVYTSLTPQPNEKPVDVKGGKQLTLTGEAVRPVSFDRKQAQTSDPLYNWSSLRSAYLGEANVNLASSYAGGPQIASGWLWDGGFDGYTWLPAGYSSFYSPFGYGFYSPGYLYGGGLIYGGYYGGGYGYRGGYYGNRGGYYGHPTPRSGGGGEFHGNGGGSHGGQAGGFQGGGGGASRGGGGGGGHR